jgi:hypothetical protein
MTDGDKVAAATLAGAYCAAKSRTEIADLMKAYAAFLREIEAQESSAKAASGRATTAKIAGT